LPEIKLLRHWLAICTGTMAYREPVSFYQDKEIVMRKLAAFVAVAVLAISFTDTASAQLRRRATVQQTYPAQQYQQSQQYQQYPQSGQPLTAGRYDTRQRMSGPMQGASLTDEQLANWLLVDNRAEVQLARMAQERAACDDVKDFAKKMIDAHSQMIEHLQSFAGAGRGMQPGAGQFQAETTTRQGRPDQQFNERGQPVTERAQQFGQPGQRFAPQGQQFGQQGQQAGGLNLVRLKQQLGQQCLASAQHELEQKEGEEFDKCYIGMQIVMHMQMLDTLKVFSRYASPQLDQIIEQAEDTTQDHLDHAKELIKDHDGKESKDKSISSNHRSSSDTHDRSSSSRD
jgi:predicted outer membrane protein